MYIVTKKNSKESGTLYTNDDFMKEFKGKVNLDFFQIPFTKHTVEVEGKTLIIEALD